MPPEHLNQMITEGRLIRGAWTGTDARGRETACLLAALAPECGTRQSPDACPAEVMPGWLAHLTPWIDDAGTLEAWPGVIRRYAAIAGRWHVLDAAAWQRAEWRVKVACVEEALCHVTTDHWGVRASCEGVLTVLRRAVETGQIDESAAAWAASAAAVKAREASAASAAAWAAKEATEASAASAARAATGAAGTIQATREAADRLTSTILSLLEAACALAEGA